MPSPQKYRPAVQRENYDKGEGRFRSLNQILVASGAVTSGNMFRAVAIQQNNDTPLERILLARDWVAAEGLLAAQAEYLGLDIIDPGLEPPDLHLIDIAGIAFCLSHNVLPWQRTDGETWVAISESGCDEPLRDKLTRIYGAVRLVLCPETQIRETIIKLRGASLIHRAENCVPAIKSCRSNHHSTPRWLCVLILGMLAAAFWWLPLAGMAIILLLASIGLVLQTTLKLICFITALQMRRRHKPPVLSPQMTAPLPVISIMVPLYKESDITDHLVKRLIQLEYPCELIDVILILESDDAVTRLAIEGADLPNWFRVIEVPKGAIKTKPRALNYGLNFCRGDIIGVWDAEDKPQPDQLHQIARHFSSAPQNVGCVQGVLDYYNPRTNWLSRCFTIEYASWFRVLLPAMVQLGLVIPLGGTTCFFRRDALQEVCGWDAWNVTEDADLGVRLACHGWHIEIVQTTTDEEANCRLLPWIRQRSRWLKGYALTWAVHMRKPLKLWRDLGAKRFIGFQVQFLTLIGQIFFTPVFWSFWLFTFGLHLPSDGEIFSHLSITLICVLFLTAEAVNLIIGLYSVSGARHRHLRKWVATMYFYFPLGYFALWKAGYELFVRPFYWDKTAHGIFDETPNGANTDRHLVQIPLVGTIGEENPPNRPAPDNKQRD